MLAYRGGMWGRTARWLRRTSAGERIFRTAGGVWIVTAPDLAHQILVEETAIYPVKPSFMRVHGDRALPAKMREATTRRLMRLLTQAQASLAADVAASGLEDGPREFQSWGIWFMREMYRPVIAAPGRSRDVDALMDEFVRSLLIEATARGRRFARVRRRFISLQRRLAAELASVPAGTGPPADDLLGIVARLRPLLSAAECAEVYLRLVTALLGATGTALEWTVALLASVQPAPELESERVPRAAVLETQRLWPSSWRLYRECARDTVLGGRRVLAGDHVIVASSVIQRDPRWWPDPDSFLPGRWHNGATPPPGAYLPFADGPGVCPARGPAIEAIRRGAGAIFQRYTAEPRFAGGSRPRALALLSPPMGELSLAARRPSLRPAG